MRVSSLRQAGDELQAQELEDFAAFLKRVGEGTEQEYPAVGESMIRIPPDMCCGGGAQASVGDLIRKSMGVCRTWKVRHVLSTSLSVPSDTPQSAC